jgi:RNA polymerase sigma-70 factor, ECF subfamily
MDTEARFRALYQSAYPILCRYARNRGLGRADAEDLVAATLEIAWRRLDDVPTEDPVPWLFAVARNVWRNGRRSLGRRETLLTRLPPSPNQPEPDEQAVESVVELREALSKLDDDDRELLRLVAWDGLTPSQAAVVIGCSPVAARTRLHRARNRLAAHLGTDPRLQRSDAGGQVPSGTNDPSHQTEVSDG